MVELHGKEVMCVQPGGVEFQSGGGQGWSGGCVHHFRHHKEVLRQEPKANRLK